MSGVFHFFLSLTPYLHPRFFPLLQFKTCSLLLLHTERHTYIDAHTFIKPTGSMHLEKTDSLLAATCCQILHKGDWGLTSWAILIWVACVVTHGLGVLWSKQLLRAMSGCPSTVSLCTDVCDSSYHLRQCRYPGSVLTLQAMLVPEGYAATKVIKI